MNKLKLRLDDLRVEAFATGARAPVHEGTVRANAYTELATKCNTYCDSCSACFSCVRDCTMEVCV